MNLEVTPDGDIRCLYSDEIDLSQLGRLQVSRASHVEFDNRLRRWTVTSSKTGERLHSAVTREDALKWEHQYYNPLGHGWKELSNAKN